MRPPDEPDLAAGTKPQPPPPVAGEAAAVAPPITGLYVRQKRTYAVPGERCGCGGVLSCRSCSEVPSHRAIEVDSIVASPDRWATCQERHEEGWEPHELHGLIVAERVTG